MADKPKFQRLSNYDSLTPKWIWKRLIPRGMNSILEGDPGTGKSYLCMDIIARLTTGRPLPNGQKMKPANCMYLTYEDPNEYTVRPRIDALKGNARKVFVMDGNLIFDTTGLDLIETTISKHKIKLVVVDPINSAMPNSQTRTRDPRPTLSRLTAIAEEHDCSIVTVRHLTKMQHDKAIYSGGGSMDFAGFARSILRVERNPNDPEKVVLALVKCNIAPMDQKSWQYRLVDQGEDKVAKFEWLGECDLTVADLMNPSNEMGSAVEDAKEFLMRELSSKPRAAIEVIALAELEGHTKRTLTRVRKTIGVMAKQKNRAWHWSIPEKGKRKK